MSSATRVAFARWHLQDSGSVCVLLRITARDTRKRFVVKRRKFSSLKQRSHQTCPKHDELLFTNDPFSLTVFGRCVARTGTPTRATANCIGRHVSRNTTSPSTIPARAVQENQETKAEKLRWTNLASHPAVSTFCI